MIVGCTPIDVDWEFAKCFFFFHTRILDLFSTLSCLSRFPIVNHLTIPVKNIIRTFNSEEVQTIFFFGYVDYPHFISLKICTSRRFQIEARVKEWFGDICTSTSTFVLLLSWFHVGTLVLLSLRSCFLFSALQDSVVDTHRDLSSVRLDLTLLTPVFQIKVILYFDYLIDKLIRISSLSNPYLFTDPGIFYLVWF